jgi:hypothetical protein
MAAIAARAALLLLTLCLPLAIPAGAAPARAKRVAIEYVPPAKSAHKPLYDMLRENQALERVQALLTPIRWPRSLKLEIKGCDGEANAWYEDGVITVCYEYLDEIWRAANSSRRPATIAREDAFVGPFVETVLHEAGHALFDLSKVPILGREEDAADQFAAYLILQMPKEKKHKLVVGAAYAYLSELKVRRPRDLYRRRLGIGRHVAFADEHGTPAQRLYNLLCIAYGSDQQLFADAVDKGYLPKTRAEQCEDEYQQVDYAWRRLIAAHIETAERARIRYAVTPIQAPAPRRRR